MGIHIYLLYAVYGQSPSIEDVVHTENFVIIGPLNLRRKPGGWWESQRTRPVCIPGQSILPYDNQTEALAASDIESRKFCIEAWRCAYKKLQATPAHSRPVTGTEIETRYEAICCTLPSNKLTSAHHLTT